MTNEERHAKIHEIKDSILETLAKEDFGAMDLPALKRAVKILHCLKEGEHA